VLHQVMLMFGEIASEMGHELSASPVRMIAEVVQFALLIAIIWVVAMGWGKRKGFVANMLAERAERTGREIETASHASGDLVSAEETARDCLAAADIEARRLVETARADAEQIEATACEEADAEARRTTERATEALASEMEEMRTALREELVSIVAQATRSILSEKLSVAEQRAAIESAIVASLGADASPPVQDNGARKTRSRPAPRSKAVS